MGVGGRGEGAARACCVGSAEARARRAALRGQGGRIRTSAARPALHASARLKYTSAKLLLLLRVLVGRRPHVAALAAPALHCVARLRPFRAPAGPGFIS